MYLRLTKHVHIHTGCLILVVLSFFVASGEFFRRMLVFAALHELFHLAAALFLRIPVLHLSFLPYGCHLSLGKTDFSSETIVAAAGPLGSFLLFLFFRGNTAGTVNLYLCLLNLLPALPLDGGRLFRLFLWKCMGIYRGNRLLRFSGIFIGCLFLAHTLFSFSVSFIYIGFLLITHTRTVSVPFLHKKAARTRVRFYSVSGTDSLHLLSRLYSPYYTILFYVRDSGQIVSEETVLSVLSHKNLLTFSDIL